MQMKVIQIFKEIVLQLPLCRFTLTYWPA